MQAYAKAPDQFGGKTMDSDKLEAKENFIKENSKQFMDDKWTLGIKQRLGNLVKFKIVKSD